MKTNKLTVWWLLVALYGGLAVAAETVVAPSEEINVPAATQKAKKDTKDCIQKKHKKDCINKHKKDCITKDGKPCPLSNQTGEATGTKSSAADKKPLENINAAAPATVAAPAAAVAAPAAAAIVAKPEVKAEAVLSEADAMQLAKKNNCFACHAIDKKLVGPAWKAVAEKYRGDTGAEARLSDKIAKGGSGKWGSTAMPPFPQISAADRKALTKFVLSLK